MKLARIAFLLLLGGCAGGGSAADECAATNPALAPECNTCLRGNCCAELSVCVQGTDCNACANSDAACTTKADKEVTAIGTCLLDRCAEACGFSPVGQGGAEDGTGGGSAGTNAASGTGGIPAGGTAGTGTAGTGGATCAVPCGKDCCKAGTVCVGDGLFGGTCAAECEANSECPMASPVCSLFEDGSSACTADMGLPQRCSAAADCASKACAPNVDAAGDPAGPYVCVPNDGGAYHGCFGLLTSCDSDHCCFTDKEQNQFCARPCTSAAECGDGKCVTYSNSNTTCSETMGCGL
jgi:hypothetical protein